MSLALHPASPRILRRHESGGVQRQEDCDGRNVIGLQPTDPHWNRRRPIVPSLFRRGSINLLLGFPRCFLTGASRSGEGSASIRNQPSPATGNRSPSSSKSSICDAKSRSSGGARHPKKGRRLLREEVDMKFGFIAKHHSVWPVAWLCEALGASRLYSPIGSYESYSMNFHMPKPAARTIAPSRMTTASA